MSPYVMAERSLLYYGCCSISGPHIVHDADDEFLRCPSLLHGSGFGHNDSADIKRAGSRGGGKYLRRCPGGLRMDLYRDGACGTDRASGLDLRRAKGDACRPSDVLHLLDEGAQLEAK